MWAAARVGGQFVRHNPRLNCWIGKPPARRCLSVAHKARPEDMDVNRRGFAAGLLALCLGLSWAASAQDAARAEPKVLRYAFRVAETGFDPAQVTDLYSRNITAAIFDSPLRYAYMARPYQLQPATLEALPEVSADFKTLTFKLRPGIYFSDDPAFGGKRRELTAADYLYSIKRHYDPKLKSGNLYQLEGAKILGLSELRREALKNKSDFDYAREVAGLKLLDRYTFQVITAEGNPRFMHLFADPMLGAVAREVVEHYGDKIMAHPVGTNAFRLADWRRSSLIVLEKNPNYRDDFYSEEPPAHRPEIAAEVRALKGRRLPMVDRVEIAIIEESQPRWLSFVRGEFDMIDDVPVDVAPIAMPNNKLAPNLAKQHIKMVRYARADVAMSYFNMEDPTVGGYTPEKVALRRAISLGVDLDKQIRLVRRGQAIASQGPIPPGAWGYEPTMRSQMSEFDPAKARALLDLYGFVDKDGDGWRDMPDGSPLVLEYATQPDGQNRQLSEQWQKNMAVLKIRIKFKIAKWPENLKAANAGKLMMWGVAWSANKPDGEDFLALGYGGNAGQANKARFRLAAFDAQYDKQKSLPDGPARQAAMDEAQRLMVAYMPIKLEVHRIFADMTQPWVLGYDRNLYQRDFWKFVDIDQEALARARR